MEKQIKIIICADDGEWSREHIDTAAACGAQILLTGKNGTALLHHGLVQCRFNLPVKF